MIREDVSEQVTCNLYQDSWKSRGNALKIEGTAGTKALRSKRGQMKAKVLGIK